MKPKGFLVFAILSLVLGLATVVLGYNWITKEANRLARQGLAVSPVLVAAVDIEPGQRLEGKDLQVAQWPTQLIPAQHLSAPGQAVGKLVKTEIAKGEVLVPGKLTSEIPKLSMMVPAGSLAMAVRVDEVVGVAGFVKAGDRVDMLVTLDKEPFKDNPISKLVLQDIGVIAVGSQLFQAKDEKTKKYTVVTLQLLPEQAEKVAIAVTEGRIVLALRNLNDRDEYRTQGQFLPTLLAGAKSPQGAKETAAMAKGGKENSRSMEIIRGVEKSDDDY